MSNQELVKQLDETPIPSILTVSLRELLPFFKERIVKLKARGGKIGQNRIILDRDCGVSFTTGSTSIIEINYEQQRAPDFTILNPLDAVKVEEIIEYLDENLEEYEDSEGRKYPPDIPIEYLVVEIVDAKIAELARTQTNTFDAVFVSEDVEPRNRKEVKTRNDALGVYHQGFKVRNLNCLELLESEQKYGLPKDQQKTTIQWGGWAKRDMSPKSSYEIASRIRFNHLPQQYAQLKTYRIMRGNQLDLDGVR